MNLGAGNLSLQNRRYANLGEAEAQRVRTINQVRQEITSARAEALAARDQIEITRSELASAENGLREDTERSRNNLGRPIEVLNSLNLVGGARVNVIRPCCGTIRPSSALRRPWLAAAAGQSAPRRPSASTGDHAASWATHRRRASDFRLGLE